MEIAAIIYCLILIIYTNFQRSYNCSRLEEIFMKIFKKVAIVLIIAVMSLSFLSSASAKTYVHGYYRKNGTYVKPHYRSDRDSNFSNNWSTKGNTNPITGKKGYKSHP
jgi:hypothetical protein